MNFCIIKTTSSQGWTSQLLGIPFFQLTDPALDMYKKGIHAFSLNCLVLKNLSPCCGRPTICAKISSDSLKFKFPTIALSPSNDSAKNRLILSLCPSNFSKKVTHYFFSKISMQFSWISMGLNFSGSSLDDILNFDRKEICNRKLQPFNFNSATVFLS